MSSSRSLFDRLGISSGRRDEEFDYVEEDQHSHAWQTKYEDLKKFYNEHGHIKEIPKKLSKWISIQRTEYRSYKHGDPNTTLTAKRIKLLNDLGIEWNPLGERWHHMYKQLRIYHAKHGHCNVSMGGNKELATWLKFQRYNLREYTLGKAKPSPDQQERIGKLDMLGMDWKPLENRWNEHYAELQEYHKQHGHSNVPSKDPNHFELSNFVRQMRVSYKDESDSLTEERKKKMDALDFMWDPLNDKWGKRYEELKDYRDKHGHCNVPAGYPENRELAHWVTEQRYKKKHNDAGFSKERIQLLNDLGFEWVRVGDVVWMKTYKEVKAFYDTYGHINFLSEGDTEELQFCHSWIKRQRNDYNSSKLSDEHIDLLNEVGFDSDPRQTQWNSKCEELAHFFAKNGRENLPTKVQDKTLYNWGQTQLKVYRAKKMKQERIDRLNAIGFPWESLSPPRAKTDQKRWMQRYDELVTYKNNHGDCNVPRFWKKNEPLAGWVARQRSVFQKDKLASDRIELLNKIGFTWKFDSTWDTQFENLKTFMEKQKESPSTYKEMDADLDAWANKQRYYYHLGDAKMMSAKRISLMKSIGFDWAFSHDSWMKSYEQVKQRQEALGKPQVLRKDFADTPELAGWVKMQISEVRKYKQNKPSHLTPEQFQLWEALSISTPTPREWDEVYEELSAYLKEHNWAYPTAASNRSLYNWVHQQRMAFQEGTLSRDRFAKLDSIDGKKLQFWELTNFPWELQTKRESSEDDLASKTGREESAPPAFMTQPKTAFTTPMAKDHKSRGASSKTEPRGLDPDPVATQVKSYQQKNDGAFPLNEKKNASNKKESPRRQLFEDRLTQVKSYQQKNHGAFPSSKKEYTLYRWLMSRRALYKEGTLSADQIKALESIGFTWTGRGQPFEDGLAQVKSYQQKNDGAFPSQKKDLALYRWLMSRRFEYKEGTLSADRIKALESIGFTWTGRVPTNKKP
eukprot:CAMPEP_0172471124 /NCGR_PEP_ID=MMETSP1065-20121228/67655_1 /TAXON_ID=265537 /ORGANISM="Amphiprora paludosa, Strain CCMP125" /LENGTH=965 /DNA_ID=CAMNT_0013229211 /DNA_START=275 /DNA_END=3172 /DNA_ORIENTATION=+